jgi:hypothetical protein
MAKREIGMWNSEAGYFQLLLAEDDERQRADILSNFPTGTRIVPLKPGEDYQYEDGRWVQRQHTLALNQIEREVNALLNRVAQSKGYDSPTTFLSYLGSTIDSWRIEAEQFVAWRDQLLVFAFALINEQTKMTLDDFLSAAPQPPWPLTQES